MKIFEYTIAGRLKLSPCGEVTGLVESLGEGVDMMRAVGVDFVVL